MLEKAAAARAVIAVGENIADARRNIELAAKHHMIRPAPGLYPMILDAAAAEQMLAFIRSEHSRIESVGEMGLDYWFINKWCQVRHKEGG